MWGLGEFIKALVWRNWLDKKDTFICITGVEGSGKSALSLSLASYIDPTFSKNLNKRILFTINDVELYDNFIMERSKRILNDEIVFPEVFIIDEGQNIFFTRTTMEKEQKELVKKVRTQRYALATIIINLPNISELDKSVVSRLSAIIMCSNQKDDRLAYVAVRNFSKFYGQLDRLYEKIMEQKRSGITPVMMPEHYYEYFDAYGKLRINRELYEKYFKVKVERSMELFSDEDSSEGNSKFYISEQRKIPIGYYISEHKFTNPTPVLYLNCWYSSSALQKILGVGINTITRWFSDLPSVKEGKYKFYLGRDIYEWLKKHKPDKFKFVGVKSNDDDKN